MEKIISDPFYYIEGRNEHHKKGGGGGVDTSGLEAATREATALQKQIYEQTREDSQPWYNMGTGAVNLLSDLLGVSGGSVQSRDQVYDELLPQYTSQQSVGGNESTMVIAPDGRVYNTALGGDFANEVGMNSGNQYYDVAMTMPELVERGDYDYIRSLGWDTMGTGPRTEDVVDYAGLNSAIDERLAGQGTPDNYGSLLERFSMDKFEEDPGYQFRKDEANKALERQMAAQGITLGGAGEGDINATAYRGMQELNQNLASQEYQNTYNRYVQDQLNTFNMLMGASGQGQGQTGIMATAGSNYANNVGNLTTGLASAQMNAQLANQSSGGGMFGSLLGAGIGLLGAPQSSVIGGWLS